MFIIRILMNQLKKKIICTFQNSQNQKAWKINIIKFLASYCFYSNKKILKIRGQNYLNYNINILF